MPIRSSLRPLAWRKRPDYPERMMASRSNVITVWTDIGCPWATLALDTLHRRATARGITAQVDHRAFPLEILNSAPITKPGHNDEIEHITAVCTDLDWSPWSQPDWTYPVTTVPALQAVQAAKLQGFEASDQLDTALRRAYFVDQRSISLLPVIIELARNCPAVDADRLMANLTAGAGYAAINADLQVISGGGIQGSPHFWTVEGPYAANPGVDDVSDFRRYDPDWADDLLSRVSKA